MRVRFFFTLICLISAAALTCSACGAEGRGDADKSPKAGRGPLKEIQWGPARTRRGRIQIGALVPYCAFTKPKPFVAEVERRRRPGKLILTMLVQFPLRVKGGCLGMGLGVYRWVNLGKSAEKQKIYDGATKPPTRRLPPLTKPGSTL